jgi:Spy/CpxP family protein refolding chaperone
MKRPLALAFTAIVVGVCALTAMSQPPEGRGAGGKKGGPPGFELGRVLPPFVHDDLDLTADQEKQIAALEEEVKQKLEKILTAEQRKKAVGARPPFGPPGKDGPTPKGFGPPPKKDDGEQARAGGIQWFATWEAGKAEAERTGRPILFVSAAPHCAGVSGIW